MFQFWIPLFFVLYLIVEHGLFSGWGIQDEIDISFELITNLCTYLLRCALVQSSWTLLEEY